MTVIEILALAKGTKIENLTGVFSKIGAFRKTATGKIRQSAVLQDNTAEIQMVIWGGKIDKFLYGSVFNIKEAYIDEYNGKKRLTINSNEAITLVQAKEGYVPKAEQSAPSGTKVTPPAQSTPTPQPAVTPATPQPQVTPSVAPVTQPVAETGAIAPKTVPIANTIRAECKQVMQECIEDITNLVSAGGGGFITGLTAENFVTMVNTLYISRDKHIRQDRY